jgi:hypothetical protein
MVVEETAELNQEAEPTLASCYRPHWKTSFDLILTGITENNLMNMAAYN